MSTIKINDKTKTKLEHLKLHKRESFNDVIERLVTSQNDELNPKTIKNIRKSLDDIEKGRVCSLRQVAKKLGL